MKKLSSSIYIATPVLLAWSWISVVDVGKISQNKFVAFCIALLMLLLTAGLVTAVYYFALKLFRKRRSKSLLKNAVLILASWPATEFFASWLPNILWYGKGGSIDTLAPFTSISLLIAHTPLAYLFRFFGLFGTSAIVVTVVYLLVHKKSRNVGYAVFAVICVISVSSYWLYKPNGQTVTVGITRQNVDSPQLISPNVASFLVIPEYGLNDITQGNLSTRIAPKDHEVFFVGSLADRNAFPEKNMLVHGSTSAGFLSQQQKSRLIPGGEYLAYVHVIPLRIINDKTIIPTFNFARATQKGGTPVRQYAFNDKLVVGSGDCSSIIAPQDYRRMVKQGANLLTNSASLDIFNNSKVYSWESESLARFIALANARAFAQSANDGASFIINSQGQKTASLQKNGYKEAGLRTNSKVTLYTLFGEWTVWLSLGYLVYTSSYSFIHNPPQKN